VPAVEPKNQREEEKAPEKKRPTLKVYSNRFPLWPLPLSQGVSGSEEIQIYEVSLYHYQGRN
jgi:hypothetical protein